MPLITDSEMEDFNAAILQAGFEVDDFSVVDLEDEPTAIEQLEAETAIEQYVPTGTVTIQRISTDAAITYSAGRLSTWVSEFEIDLHEGKFDRHRFERLRCRLSHLRRLRFCKLRQSPVEFPARHRPLSPGAAEPCTTSTRKEDRMDQLDYWLQRISEGKIDAALKYEIADKILELLEQKKDSLGTWEKILFAQAITELSINWNSIFKPTEAGLRRSLIALQKAMIPEIERNESYAQRDDKGEPITYEMLVATVKKIKEQIL